MDEHASWSEERAAISQVAALYQTEVSNNMSRNTDYTYALLESRSSTSTRSEIRICSAQCTSIEFHSTIQSTDFQ